MKLFVLMLSAMLMCCTCRTCALQCFQGFVHDNCEVAQETNNTNVMNCSNDQVCQLETNRDQNKVLGGCVSECVPGPVGCPEYLGPDGRCFVTCCEEDLCNRLILPGCNNEDTTTSHTTTTQALESPATTDKLTTTTVAASSEPTTTNSATPNATASNAPTGLEPSTTPKPANTSSEPPNPTAAPVIDNPSIPPPPLEGGEEGSGQANRPTVCLKLFVAALTYLLTNGNIT